MGAKGSVEAAKMNADNWGHLEVCIRVSHSKLSCTSRLILLLLALTSFIFVLFKTEYWKLVTFLIFFYANSRCGNFSGSLRMENCLYTLENAYVSVFCALRIFL